MLPPEKIDRYLEVATENALEMSKASWSFLKVAIFAAICAAFIAIAEQTWTRRVEWMAQVYNAIAHGSDSAVLINEWNSTDPAEFPSLWDCSFGKCEPNMVKQGAVLAELTELRNKTGAVRSSLSLYAAGTRRIVAQSNSAIVQPIPASYWRMPVTGEPFRSMSLEHRTGTCAVVALNKLPMDNEFSQNAAYFSRTEIRSCPLDVEDIPASVVGYVSIDLDGAGLMSTEDLNDAVSETAEALEDILGFSEQTPPLGDSQSMRMVVNTNG